MSRELKGIAIILSIYFCGEAISYIIGGFMPGSVIGMVLLFGLLQKGVVKVDEIKDIANFVLNNMMLFFVPVSVGLMVSYKLIASEWVTVLAVMLLSTIIVMVATGLLQQFFGRKWKK